MEEGTILSWLKSEGDEVAVGDELVEIETDKANMVYESDAAGILIEIVAGEGDTLGIGEVIARVGEAGEASGNGAGQQRKKEKAKATAAEQGGHPRGTPGREAEDVPRIGSEAAAARSTEGDGRIKASPIARRIA